MPIYTFKCQKGHIRDLIVRYDTEETECPKCGKKTVRVGNEPPSRRNPDHGIQR
jgi:putative FmdB family regulatory protein